MCHPGTGEVRPEDLKFEIYLGHIVRSCLKDKTENLPPLLSAGKKIKISFYFFPFVPFP